MSLSVDAVGIEACIDLSTTLRTYYQKQFMYCQKIHAWFCHRTYVGASPHCAIIMYHTFEHNIIFCVNLYQILYVCTYVRHVSSEKFDRILFAYFTGIKISISTHICYFLLFSKNRFSFVRYRS